MLLVLIIGRLSEGENLFRFSFLIVDLAACILLCNLFYLNFIDTFYSILNKLPFACIKGRNLNYYLKKSYSYAPKFKPVRAKFFVNFYLY